eukprot:362980-Chlamydomonas_euryale.AAC.2
MRPRRSGTGTTQVHGSVVEFLPPISGLARREQGSSNCDTYARSLRQTRSGGHTPSRIVTHGSCSCRRSSRTRVRQRYVTQRRRRRRRRREMRSWRPTQAYVQSRGSPRGA